MDRYTTQSAANTMVSRMKALDWLLKYGEELGDATTGNLEVRLDLLFASELTGSSEATDALRDNVGYFVPDIVARAIAQCREDIDAARNVLDAELASVGKAST